MTRRAEAAEALRAALRQTRARLCRMTPGEEERRAERLLARAVAPMRRMVAARLFFPRFCSLVRERYRAADGGVLSWIVHLTLLEVALGEEAAFFFRAGSI